MALQQHKLFLEGQLIAKEIYGILECDWEEPQPGLSQSGVHSSCFYVTFCLLSWQTYLICTFLCISMALINTCQFKEVPSTASKKCKHINTNHIPPFLKQQHPSHNSAILIFWSVPIKRILYIINKLMSSFSINLPGWCTLGSNSKNRGNKIQMLQE